MQISFRQFVYSGTIIIILFLVNILQVNSQRLNIHDKTFEPITVSGKVIIDSINRVGTKYFLDADNDGTKDYQLSFGPKWYNPSSGATRPLNGESITIKGDLFITATPPLIIVYEINGLKWRDSIGTRFIFNPVKPDSNKRHGHWGNRFGWSVKDSLIDISVTGKVKIDSLSAHHKVYYLYKDNDTTYDYILMFGPWWYQPTSGATRPNDGATVNIKGGLIQRTGVNNTTLNFIVVYEIDGKTWIDSIRKFPWPGWKLPRGHNSSVKISSIYNPGTNCIFSERSFGMANPNIFSNEIYSSIMELDPVYLPLETGRNVIAAYSVNIMDDNLNGLFIKFDKKISLTLSYTQNEIINSGAKNKELKLKFIDDNNDIVDVPFAGFNYTNNTVSFSQFMPSGIYFIESQSAESTSEKTVSSISKKFELAQNYPNPFNPSTVISFSLPERSNIKLTIYSLIGTKVRELVKGNYESGSYNITWDGKDFSGNKVSSGIYFYKLETGANTLTKKMNLLK